LSANQAVFVQAVIFNEDTHTLSTYNPLVIDAGTTPAATPVVPVMPAHTVVALFGGGNDDVTTLVGPGAASCVNGAASQVFGQVFFCNGVAFFAAVNAAHISIPPLGMGSDGKVCPSVRDFRIVDQDQSDNVQTTYLVTASGQTAQNTAANRAALPGATLAKNPSDNRLLTNFVDPAIGCKPWLIPDIGDNGNMVPTQATDELQAAAYQGSPVALIPAGDPMVGPNVLTMINAYRVNVDQKSIKQLAQASTTAYCGNVKTYAPPFIAAHKAAFQASSSPAVGVNLYDFLQARLAATQAILGCRA